jgi:hypothetical protein
MTDTLIKVDLTQSPTENENIHNRWHPDIPMACWVNPGDDFILETFDWTGGFIKNNDSADDVRDIDLSTVHYLSGPVGVKGAEPGDLLVVDLLDIGAKQDSLWGFNGFFSKQNGGGFLTDHFPEAQKSIWDFKGMFTSSRHIPRVNFAGLIHPGPHRLPARQAHARHVERARRQAHRHRPRPRAGPRQPALCRHRPHGQDDRRRARQGRGRGRAHRAAARARRQLRHQGPVARLQGVLPRVRRRRGPERGRPALQPGRRRDHLLRRHRDGGLGAHESDAHQGRHGQVRHQEPHLQAQPHHAATTTTTSSSRASRWTRAASSTTST